MFSGIIRILGKITHLEKSTDGVAVQICSTLFRSTNFNIGDSICTNGVCLTISELNEDGAKFFIVNESLRRSNLSELEIGDYVHLEPSLRVGDTIDGHFVYGHVDATAEIVEIARDGEAYRFNFKVPTEILEFLAPKGSVSLNGVSLTVGEVGKKNFSVYIVPHTFKETQFSSYKLGDQVNLEIDPLARYLVNYLRRKESK